MPNLKVCKNCHQTIVSTARTCPYCGAKQNQMPIWAIVVGVFLLVAVIANVLNQPTQPEVKVSTEPPLSSSALERSQPPTAPTEANDTEKEPSGVTGVEVQRDGVYGEKIDDFIYELDSNRVVLKSPRSPFNKKNNLLEINSTYSIDGKTYTTDLLDFRMSSAFETLILDEGIEEVSTSIFNSSDIKKVFFPKSMTNVFDYTLAYIYVKDGQKVKIYYAGTQDEWANIFTEYKRTAVEDAEWGYDKGVAMADWVNEKVGVQYDSELFEYFFSATPDDLK